MIAPRSSQSRQGGAAGRSDKSPGRELVHDLRNCLMALQAGAAALQKGSCEAADRDRLHAAIADQVQKLATLIARTERMLAERASDRGSR